MKKILVLIILTLFFNCKKSINEDPKVDFEPIFFGLSPKMTDEQFNIRIEQEPFVNGIFKFPLHIEKNNSTSDNLIDSISNSKREIIDFQVEKRNNRIEWNNTIILSSDLSYKLDSIDLNKHTTKFIKERDQMEIETLISIYEDKYPWKHSNNIDSFSNWKKTLVLYGFSKDSYRVFQDSIKTILIGYTLHSREELSVQDLKQMLYEINTGNVDNEKWSFLHQILDEEYIYKVESERNWEEILKFGYEIEINYLHNDDFNEITNQIWKGFERDRKWEVKKDSMEIQRVNSLLKNLEGI